MSDLADACRAAASTMQRLFDAQRKHPMASPLPSHQNAQAAVQHEQSQRSTLHKFWSLPPSHGSTVQPMSMQVEQTVALGIGTDLRCEDCDRSLRDDDKMDLDESAFEEDMGCIACHRHVCGACAILGDERICLSCACQR